MEVDPDILRALAGQVDVASGPIREANVGGTVVGAADGLDGSTQLAARLVGANVKEDAEKITTNVSNMGSAVRGAGDTYEVTDADLADNFRGIF
ncbi:WXG100 family type VII secretion target [Mycolicibacterium thermoresistibile]